MELGESFDAMLEALKSATKVLADATDTIDRLMKLSKEQNDTIDQAVSRIAKLIVERDNWKARAEYAESNNRGIAKVN